MASKLVSQLDTEADYEEAIDEIERHFLHEPKIGTPVAERFDLLARLVEDYENRLWPIEAPSSR